MCCNILQQQRAASTSLRTRSSASTAKSFLFVSFPSPPLSFYSFYSFPSSLTSPASPGSMSAGVPLDCSSPRLLSPDALCGSSSLISLSFLSSSSLDRRLPPRCGAAAPLVLFLLLALSRSREDRAAPPPLPRVVQVHEEGELLPGPVPHQLRLLHRAPPPPSSAAPWSSKSALSNTRQRRAMHFPITVATSYFTCGPSCGAQRDGDRPTLVVDSSMLGPVPARPVARPCRPPPRSTTSIDSPSPARGASPGDRSRLPPRTTPPTTTLSRMPEPVVEGGTAEICEPGTLALPNISPGKLL